MFDPDKPSVAVVGRFQIGKSTLINCLLDDRVARTGSGVATTKISAVYHYGQIPVIEVARKWNHGEGLVWEPVGQRLLDFLAAGEEWRGISAARIALWKPLLGHINLVDTPGIDANADDTALAVASLKEADYALVVLENRGLSDVELRLFADIQRCGLPFSVVVNCRDRQGKRWLPEHNRDIVDSLKAEFASRGIAPTAIGSDGGIWICNLLWFWHASEHIYEDADGEELVADIAHYFSKHLKIAPTATNTCDKSKFMGVRLFFENYVWQLVKRDGGRTLSIASQDTLDFIEKRREEHKIFAADIKAVLPLCWRAATPQYKPYEPMVEHSYHSVPPPAGSELYNNWHRDFAILASIPYPISDYDEWTEAVSSAMVGWLDGVLQRILAPYMPACDESAQQEVLEKLGAYYESLDLDRFRHVIKMELFALRERYRENIERWQRLMPLAKKCLEYLNANFFGKMLAADNPDTYRDEAVAVLKDSKEFFTQVDMALDYSIAQLVAFWRSAFPILENLIRHIDSRRIDLSAYAYDKTIAVKNLPLLPETIFSERMKIYAGRILEGLQSDHESWIKRFYLFRRMGIPIEACSPTSEHNTPDIDFQDVEVEVDFYKESGRVDNGRG